MKERIYSGDNTEGIRKAEGKQKSDKKSAVSD